MKRIFSTAGKIDPWKIVMVIFFSILIGGLFLFLATIYYLMFFEDNPPAEIIRAEFEDTSPVRPGDVVTMDLEWCKFTDATAEVRRSWSNDINFNIPTGPPPVAADPGCYHLHIPIHVPDTLPPSTYDLLTSYTYKVNPLTERTITYRAGPIVVLPLEDE